MPPQVMLEKSYPVDALAQLYRSEHDGRLKERLLAILLLYREKSITAAAELVQVRRQTVSKWVQAWNKGGYQGLKPRFSGGYRARLSEQEWGQVVAHIQGKGYEIEQVRQWIRQEKGVDYTYKMVWYKLRKQYKVPYGKPYIENGKMPKNAPQQVEKK